MKIFIVFLVHTSHLSCLTYKCASFAWKIRFAYYMREITISFRDDCLWKAKHFGTDELLLSLMFSGLGWHILLLKLSHRIYTFNLQPCNSLLFLTRKIIWTLFDSSYLLTTFPYLRTLPKYLRIIQMCLVYHCISGFLSFPVMSPLAAQAAEKKEENEYDGYIFLIMYPWIHEEVASDLWCLTPCSALHRNDTSWYNSSYNCLTQMLEFPL